MKNTTEHLTDEELNKIYSGLEDEDMETPEMRYQTIREATDSIWHMWVGVVWAAAITIDLLWYPLRLLLGVSLGLVAGLTLWFEYQKMNLKRAEKEQLDEHIAMTKAAQKPKK